MNSMDTHKNDQKLNASEPALIFLLQDAGGSFSVSIETIIECLQIADQLGEIPSIPEDWKARIPDEMKVIVEF